MSLFQEFNRGKLSIIHCDSGKHFAEKVISSLKDLVLERGDDANKQILVNSAETIFANGEIKTELEDCVRNQDVYIFQDVENKSNGLSVNDNFMALKTAINATKLSNAQAVTAVVPVFAYARQDRQKGRESITAALVARELEDCGANRVITLDIHNEAIAGFFRIATLENLRASKTLIEHIKKNYMSSDLIIVAPDEGGVERANYFAKNLMTELAVLYKKRDYSCANKVECMALLGDVKNKDVFVIDDIIDTAGTLVTAAKELKENGARRVYFGASLDLFNGPAVSRINKAYSESLIDKIIGTNVTYKPSNFKENNSWYDQVSLQSYFAKVICNINEGRSISRLLD
ncbi:ribose-phosphate pyrophosphokinase [Candidatus Woesearchaeota archaeon]|nr:ribose-phosphate pyrophosphokinase [Candidatus Woesearchaeota archaeon]